MEKVKITLQIIHQRTIIGCNLVDFNLKDISRILPSKFKIKSYREDFLVVSSQVVKVKPYFVNFIFKGNSKHYIKRQ